MKNTPVPVEHIARSILVLRGHKVILDADLAALYGVETRRLNEQVRRNQARFPADFVFQLSTEEFAALMSQIAISNPSTSGRGGRRKRPLVFTEHGAIMAAMVLNSARATEVSVYVVRAFVQMREALSAHKDLARKMRELEARIERRIDDQDETIAEILAAIRQLMAPPPPAARRPIGFVHPKEK